MPSPTEAVAQVKTEVNFKMKSGTHVKMFRGEPFRFYNKIEEWMNDINNVGKIYFFNMHTDVNGWVNMAIAYDEFVPGQSDPVSIQFDTVQLLKDTVEELSKLSREVHPSNGS
jgi:hypothetical protein